MTMTALSRRCTDAVSIPASRSARTDLAEEALHPLLDEGAGVDLEHEVRAAPKVEAERHLLLGNPARKLGERRLREQVRECRDDAAEDDGGIGREQPA